MGIRITSLPSDAPSRRWGWMALPAPTLSALLALASLGLSGCLLESNNKVAGGAEDFPNTVALGEAMSDHIADHSDWNQFSNLPAIPSFQDADSLAVPLDTLPAKAKTSANPAPQGNGEVTVTAKALSKTGASALVGIGDTLIWDYSDTAGLQIVRRYFAHDNVLRTHHDTTVIRYDAAFKAGDTAKVIILKSRGVDVWRVSGRIQSYKYENTDSSGPLDKATFFEHIPASGGRFKNSILITLGGPDRDINTKPDNRPAYYAYALTQPAATGSAVTGSSAAGSSALDDTVEFFSISDADGDGQLWGDGDSGIVNFRQKKTNPVLRPSVTLLTQTMRTMLFKDQAKTYPISFSETRDENDGKRVVFSVKGVRSDSTFDPGDTVAVSVHVDFPPNSRKVQKHTRYVVVLGKKPLGASLANYQDCRLIRYTQTAVWNGADSLATSKLTLIPDSPTGPQELTVNGALDFDSDFGNGHTVSAGGRFDAKKIDVTAVETRPNGKHHFHFLWDALGKLLSKARLD